ncbi:Inner centromere protein A [Hondaea fermentalgiana]|uniref:Inner centromere protein A n=1 Tax=Hondaea fermentalgiana TaxID=2315210 RepID=A0A2R5G8H7_9STRA|nr:Inner centromere protein A [Hondaea fermentalgiana]|eukprot:GBG24783.1 Inner centromere protein A [Hondaea fermentalgiana]
MMTQQQTGEGNIVNQILDNLSRLGESKKRELDRELEKHLQWARGQFAERGGLILSNIKDCDPKVLRDKSTNRTKFNTYDQDVMHKVLKQEDKENGAADAPNRRVSAETAEDVKRNIKRRESSMAVANIAIGSFAPVPSSNRKRKSDEGVAELKRISNQSDAGKKLRVAGAGPPPQPKTSADFIDECTQLTVAKIKAALKKRGISFKGYRLKADVAELLASDMATEANREAKEAWEREQELAGDAGDDEDDQNDEKHDDSDADIDVTGTEPSDNTGPAALAETAGPASSEKDDHENSESADAASKAEGNDQGEIDEAHRLQSQSLTTATDDDAEGTVAAIVKNSSTPKEDAAKSSVQVDEEEQKTADEKNKSPAFKTPPGKKDISKQDAQEEDHPPALPARPYALSRASTPPSPESKDEGIEAMTSASPSVRPSNLATSLEASGSANGPQTPDSTRKNSLESAPSGRDGEETKRRKLSDEHERAMTPPPPPKSASVSSVAKSILASGSKTLTPQPSGTTTVRSLASRQSSLSQSAQNSLDATQRQSVEPAEADLEPPSPAMVKSLRVREGKIRSASVSSAGLESSPSIASQLGNSQRGSRMGVARSSFTSSSSSSNTPGQGAEDARADSSEGGRKQQLLEEMENRIRRMSSTAPTSQDVLQEAEQMREEARKRAIDRMRNAPSAKIAAAKEESPTVSITRSVSTSAISNKSSDEKIPVAAVTRPSSQLTHEVSSGSMDDTTKTPGPSSAKKEVGVPPRGTVPSNIIRGLTSFVKKIPVDKTTSGKPPRVKGVVPALKKAQIAKEKMERLEHERREKLRLMQEMRMKSRQAQADNESTEETAQPASSTTSSSSSFRFLKKKIAPPVAVSTSGNSSAQSTSGGGGAAVSSGATGFAIAKPNVVPTNITKEISSPGLPPPPSPPSPQQKEVAHFVESSSSADLSSKPQKHSLVDIAPSMNRVEKEREESSAVAESDIERDDQLDERREADNYALTDASDDDDDSLSSPSESETPQKPVPEWAQKANLQRALHRQYFDERRDPDKIFGKIPPCDLEVIFKSSKKRYKSRGSSGIWLKDGLTLKETKQYRKDLGLE